MYFFKWVEWGKNIFFFMKKDLSVCIRYLYFEVILSYNNFLSLEFYDFFYQKKYLINLDVSVCFESGGSCEISVFVLEYVVLLKVDCDWLQNF